jgi:hypothetical protein
MLGREKAQTLKALEDVPIEEHYELALLLTVS